MYQTAFLKKYVLLFVFFALISCDKEFNAVGDDLIGDNNFDLGKEYYTVKAFNQKTDAVQTNNTVNNPINALGIFSNGPFATTTASFATQVSLAELAVKIGANPVMDSVVVTIPYFSKVVSTDNTTGIKTYELDSIYGTEKAPFKLSIYESGYFMRNLDPSTNFTEAQAFYSDQKNDFEVLKIGSPLNDSPSTVENTEFYFNPKEIAETTKDAETEKTTTTRSKPAMRLKLNKDFFTNKILKASSEKLATTEAFTNYFRGLYFKVEKTGPNENMAMIDFSKGKIVLYYKEDESTTSDANATVKRINKTLELKLSGNTVNFLETSNIAPGYSDALANANPTNGDDKLFIKGGNGSIAILELFGPDKNNNGVADELEAIRKNNWLINEANLVFHIDAEAMKNSVEPDRIFVYNLTNKTPVLDYFTDATSGREPKKNKFVLDGMLRKQEGTNGRGLTYKVRITNQIKTLIKNADSTNVKLGVSVIEDINVGTFNKLRTPNTFFSVLPTSSVYNPLGTILYGGSAAIPENKRLRLEIIYTQPK